MIAPSGTQNEKIHSIFEDLYPHSADESFGYYYAHTDTMPNITSCQCLKDLELNIQKYIKDWENEHNETILRSDIVGHYLTNATEIQEITTKQNGTILMFDFELDGKDLYKQYVDFEDIIKDAEKDSCTDEQRTQFKSGCLGLAQFLVDIRQGLI